MSTEQHASRKSLCSTSEYPEIISSFYGRLLLTGKDPRKSHLIMRAAPKQGHRNGKLREHQFRSARKGLASEEILIGSADKRRGEKGTLETGSIRHHREFIDKCEWEWYKSRQEHLRGLSSRLIPRFLHSKNVRSR